MVVQLLRIAFCALVVVVCLLLVLWLRMRFDKLVFLFWGLVFILILGVVRFLVS